MNLFCEMLFRNEEFVFQYKNCSYEIVWGNKNELRLYSNGNLLGQYANQVELLQNCKLNNKILLDIVNEIIVN